MDLAKIGNVQIEGPSGPQLLEMHSCDKSVAGPQDLKGAVAAADLYAVLEVREPIAQRCVTRCQERRDYQRNNMSSQLHVVDLGCVARWSAAPCFCRLRYAKHGH